MHSEALVITMVIMKKFCQEAVQANDNIGHDCKKKSASSFYFLSCFVAKIKHSGLFKLLEN